ncbi:MAG TPA: NAD-dependent epimerase/dehydratase family protein [Elusimicrobiota bacterium]|jgi:ADP-L-glycero-D-manno-heptose 6-epimerase|nr:NAD-dependent epimerase/dehydratase family protein [Elusimicrobiota bacterium]HNA61388.1 NAD-dependent epimerase/dehydratase family protein [Elusimicrobiota bacterium]HNF58382.1 NAD-dependent epimerase/dehydratase family protein [Elusimicrobiota bacterium]HNG44244.1 NAD-dependent epimerase/dehydratase family protein [Elusimicrobiota bacterium]
MRFLVTGAGGLIGANVSLTLAQRGHDVHALDHFAVGRRENLADFKGTVHTGDIRDFDFAALGRFDGVFHQAAITDTTVMDEKLMRDVNVHAFVRILEAAHRTGTPKVVYASSAATYGKGPVPNREDQTPAPANIYGVSKVEMEQAAKAFTDGHPAVQAVGLRYFNVYGPLEFHKKAAASMIYQLYLQIAAGKSPRIFKWGEQYRDFVYVKDVVAANWKAWEYAGNGVFNVGTGLGTTFNDLIAHLGRALGVTPKTEYFDNPYGFYQEATRADMNRSNTKMGFKAAFPPADGIADYVHFLKTRTSPLPK